MKDRVISSNDEIASAKLESICENGQILMTINNLYNKVSQPENWQIVQTQKVVEG